MTSFDDHLNAMRDNPYSDAELVEALAVVSTLSRLAELPPPAPSRELSLVLRDGLEPGGVPSRGHRPGRLHWTRRGVVAIALTAGLSGSLVGTAAAYDRLPDGVRDVWQRVVGAIAPSGDDVPPAHPRVQPAPDTDGTESSHQPDPVPPRLPAEPSAPVGGTEASDGRHSDTSDDDSREDSARSDADDSPRSRDDDHDRSGEHEGTSEPDDEGGDDSPSDGSDEPSTGSDAAGEEGTTPDSATGDGSESTD